MSVLDWLLGRRCALGCGHRVFPKDLTTHVHVQHQVAVDPGPEPMCGRHTFKGPCTLRAGHRHGPCIAVPTPAEPAP